MQLRASSVGAIMTPLINVLTETQSKELDLLMSKVKLTDKQAEKRDKLSAIRESEPELSTGGKTHILEAVLFDKYGIKKEIGENKYFAKGNACESELISLVSELDDEFYLKNDIRVRNEFLTGECDINADDRIIDVKCSWDGTTFPWMATEIENKVYYWQGVAYCLLYNKSKFELIYGLINTPKDILEKWERNFKFENHNFDRIPNEKRVKRFTIDVTQEMKDKLMLHLKIANKYYNEIYEKL